MKVAVHQPNYLPYCGFFHKMRESDVFVLLDKVDYPQGGSYANRNRIKTPNGVQWLTVPVHKGKTYRDCTFAEDWKDKHLKTLRYNYAGSDYFDSIYGLIEPVIKMCGRPITLNATLIYALSRWINIKTEIMMQSDIAPAGNKNDMIVDLCKRLKADTYVSGTGAKDYNDEQLLNDNGIELEYSDWEPEPYPQLWGDFVPNLSVIDKLFNTGEL